MVIKTKFVEMKTKLKLERLKPVEPKKSLLEALEKQDSICDLIGQSLVMEAKELELERSALADIYQDCKADTERVGSHFVYMLCNNLDSVFRRSVLYRASGVAITSTMTC